MTALGDVALVNPRATAIGKDELISFVGMAQLDATSATATPLETRAFGDVSRGYTPFLDGDILLAKITPCWENGKVGQAALDHRVGVGSTEFHVVRPGPDLDDRYLLHFLRQLTVRVAGEARMTGSAGQKRVPAAFVSDLEIPLPPLHVQRRRASVLDRAEGIRSRRRRLQSLLLDLGTAVFADLFNHDEYARTPLKEIADVRGGKRLPKGSSYSTGPTAHPYIRVVDLHQGEVTRSNIQYISPDTHRAIKRYVVGADDVIISIAGTIGLTATVPPDLVGANLTENAARIVPRRDGLYRAPWLAYALRTPEAQAQIQRQIGQVTIGKLALFRVEGIEIPLPPIEVQDEFLARLAKAGSAARTMRSGHDDELFASLEARAFRGEL